MALQAEMNDLIKEVSKSAVKDKYAASESAFQKSASIEDNPQAKIEILKKKLREEKQRTAHVESNFQKKLATTQINLNQRDLAIIKLSQKYQDEVTTLKQELKEVRATLTSALATKKEVAHAQNSVPAMSNKEIYASLKKDRDYYHCELILAEKEVTLYRQKWEEVTGSSDSVPTMKKEGAAPPMPVLGKRRASSISLSSAFSRRAASAGPSTPPTRGRKAYGEAQDSPATSQNGGTPRPTSVTRQLSTPRTISSSRSYNERQRTVSRGISGFQQVREGLAKVDKLTGEQLEQLREGLKLKVIMIAGQGFHVVGPFIRRNPSHREYVTVEGDASDDV